VRDGYEEAYAPVKELLGAPETYQDGEFYQALLGEFLESSTDQSSHKIHREPKNRKIVDRRASKGRKIRYHVHEKLVNFMTPDEADVPEYASRIFANLFGHRKPQEG
jgi:protein AATF/BFR2